MITKQTVEFCNETFYPTKWNHYFVSKNGNVYSDFSNRILKPVKDRDGYLRVNLRTSDGRRQMFAIHRIVALTFKHDEMSDGDVVDHINFDITDNRVDNLRFISSKENVSRSHKNVTPRMKVSCHLVVNDVEYHFDSIKKMLDFLHLKRRHLVEIRNGRIEFNKLGFKVIDFIENKRSLKIVIMKNGLLVN